VKAFSELLRTLAFDPSRIGKERAIRRYFDAAPDPDRGHALAALCGMLTFHSAKPGLLKALIATRTDPVLFRLAYVYVGDLAETIALMWPAPLAREGAPPSLDEVIRGLQGRDRGELAARLADWLDRLDETGRWALLKLVTGALRVGVSEGIAKAALAAWGGVAASAIEEIWHALDPPYEALFAWLEGRAPRPDTTGRLTFISPMLAHPIDREALAELPPSEFLAEWKWDGIRVQAIGGAEGARALFSRSGEAISAAFPDLLAALDFEGTIDGELVVLEEGRIGTFGALQQRLNRKRVPDSLRARHPAQLIAYDLLIEKGRDLRGRPFDARRAMLEAMLEAGTRPQIHLSPLIGFDDWSELARAREESLTDPAKEGIMLKRRASPYLAGRPRGHWFKWKRDPYVLDCVLMYAETGHGRRSSRYSDFTFGLWRIGAQGPELVPVGKAYSGITDAELDLLDRFVKRHTIARFGPVREVAHSPGEGIVFEIAFDGVRESSRHKSGLAMRFPRIARLRLDKTPEGADRLESLAAMLRE